MDSPVSCNSSSSATTMSPQMFSPLPIRALCNKKNNLESLRFFDLMEDLEEVPLSLNRASSHVIEKLHRTSVEDTDDTEFERPTRKSFGELERKSITNDFFLNENNSEIMRPPLRASNPQIYDQNFVKMDQQGSFSRKDKDTFTKIQKVLNWV